MFVRFQPDNRMTTSGLARYYDPDPGEKRPVNHTPGDEFMQTVFPNFRYVSTAAVTLLLAIVLASPSAMAQDSTPGPDEPVASQCSDGQLRVGDLQYMDEEWQRFRGMLDARAQEWEADAFMTALRVNCGILEPGYRWSGTYYSPSQQAFFETDSGTAVGAEFDPDDAAELPSDLKFGSVWRALIKAGYTDDTHLTATIGVSLQVNSEATPLGPGEVPVGATVCHVGLDHLGEIRDVFVTIDDGVVYRHTFG